MRIDILSIFPDLVLAPLKHSILKRAIDKKLVEIEVHDIRSFSTDKHGRVDDYAFGGGAGMVMCIEPIERAINYLKEQRTYDEIVYTSPDGELYGQQHANQISTLQNIMILCGHYKGIDQRIRDNIITREISIGDYVLTGGELAASVITDSVVRLIPGVLSDETSALTDSFQDNLLAPPVYTRPADYKGWKVPDVLMSGHAAAIDNWRHEQSLKRTAERRPDLFRKWEEGGQ